MRWPNKKTTTVLLLLLFRFFPNEKKMSSNYQSRATESVFFDFSFREIPTLRHAIPSKNRERRELKKGPSKFYKRSFSSRQTRFLTTRLRYLFAVCVLWFRMVNHRYNEFAEVKVVDVLTEYKPSVS